MKGRLIPIFGRMSDPFQQRQSAGLRSLGKIKIEKKLFGHSFYQI
jgi:hypothetical protein